MSHSNERHYPPALSYLAIYSPKLRLRRLNINTGKLQESPILFYATTQPPEFYPTRKRSASRRRRESSPSERQPTSEQPPVTAADATTVTTIDGNPASSLPPPPLPTVKKDPADVDPSLYQPFNGGCPVDLDTQLKEIGLAQAVASFSHNFSHPAETLDGDLHTQIVRSEKRRTVIFQPETDVWFALCVVLPRKTRPIPGGDNAMAIEFLDHELCDASLVSWLQREYHAYRLLYGPIRPRLMPLMESASDNGPSVVSALEMDLHGHFGKIVWGCNSRWDPKGSAELDLVHTVGGLPRKLLSPETSQDISECWDLLQLWSRSTSGAAEPGQRALSVIDKGKQREQDTGNDKGEIHNSLGQFGDHGQGQPAAVGYGVPHMSIYWQGKDLMWESAFSDHITARDLMPMPRAVSFTLQALNSWVRATYAKAFVDPPHYPLPPPPPPPLLSPKGEAAGGACSSLPKQKDAEGIAKKATASVSDAASIFSSILGISTKLVASPFSLYSKDPNTTPTRSGAKSLWWPSLLGASASKRDSGQPVAPEANDAAIAEHTRGSSELCRAASSLSLREASYHSEESGEDKPDPEYLFPLPGNITSTLSNAVSALVEPRPPPSVKQDSPFRAETVLSRPTTMVFNDTPRPAKLGASLSRSISDRASEQRPVAGNIGNAGDPLLKSKQGSNVQPQVQRKHSAISLSTSVASSAFGLPTDGHYYPGCRSYAPSLYSVPGNSGTHHAGDFLNEKSHIEGVGSDYLALPGVHPDYTFVSAEGDNGFALQQSPTIRASGGSGGSKEERGEAADLKAPDTADIESMVTDAVCNTLFPDTADLVDDTRGLVLAPRGVPGMQYDKRHLRHLYGSFVNMGPPPPQPFASPDRGNGAASEVALGGYADSRDRHRHEANPTCESPLWIGPLRAIGHDGANARGISLLPATESSCQVFAYKYGELLFLVLIDGITSGPAGTDRAAYQAIERIIHPFAPSIHLHAIRDHESASRLCESTLPFRQQTRYLHKNLATQAVHGSFVANPGVVSGSNCFASPGNSHDSIYFMGHNAKSYSASLAAEAHAPPSQPSLSPWYSGGRGPSRQPSDTAAHSSPRKRTSGASNVSEIDQLRKHDMLLNDSFSCLNPVRSPSMSYGQWRHTPKSQRASNASRNATATGRSAALPSPRHLTSGQKNSSSSSSAKTPHTPVFRDENKIRHTDPSRCTNEDFKRGEEMHLHLYSEFLRHTYIRDISIRLPNQTWTSIRATQPLWLPPPPPPLPPAAVSSSSSSSSSTYDRATAVEPLSLGSPTYGHSRHSRFRDVVPSLWFEIVPQHKATLADVRVFMSKIAKSYFNAWHLTEDRSS